MLGVRLCRDSDGTNTGPMFSCMRAERDREQAELKRTNSAIEKTIREDRKRMRNMVKILLLGCGEAGKSTFIKQMKIIHSSEEEAWTSDQKCQYKREILMNVIQCIQTLLEENKGELELGLANNASMLMELMPDSESDHKKLHRYREFVQAIWEDPAIQNTYRRRREFSLPDCCKYFLSQIERITDPEFTPTAKDILQIRVKTTGVVEYNFQMKHNSHHKEIIMIDVGGQRSERKKWIHFFSDVLLLMFLTAASEYDQTLEEDSNQNRMRESLDLFNVILSYEWFSNSSVALFLNKKDLLEEKIAESHLEDYFPGFRKYKNYKKKDYNSAMEYIKEMFIGQQKSDGTPLIDQSERSLFVHETCATDTDNVRKVFEDVKRTIMKIIMRVHLQ